jgi:RNA polymerase sigma-32 factor
MDNKSLVKIGTTAAQRRLFYNLRKEADKLLMEYDRLDTKLLAEKLDVKEKDVIDMHMRLSSSDISLDAPFEQGDTGSEFSPRGVMIADQQESVEDLLASEQIKSLFGQYLTEFEKTLKSRDLEIFHARLMNEQPLTLQQLGDKYGITRERARQLENKIIQALREFVRKKGQIEV